MRLRDLKNLAVHRHFRIPVSNYALRNTGSRIDARRAKEVQNRRANCFIRGTGERTRVSTRREKQRGDRLNHTFRGIIKIFKIYTDDNNL